ncbi:hypothetical protein [Jiella mangrovi]|uniref:Uncharacterized protein n=1 Tax=Jiella mangrovi TaxID=2821407 RepID=A0ABS4BK63_9HYPH|nr:hypothetical protein [Jiella mangrovi]MBP0617141.1 hypothetical protein [Jiella mangrovi]
MKSSRLPLLVVLALLPLAGACGGMNRAVTTVPKTFDDLAVETAPLRDGRRVLVEGGSAQASC